MEFICTNSQCKKVFRPHPFIGFRHPGNAKCPNCGAKGNLTEKGREIRKERLGEMNKANKEYC